MYIKDFATIHFRKYQDALNAFNTANSIDNSYVQSWLWKARSEVALEKFDDAK